MRYFAQYIVGRNGPIDVFLQPQTPRLIAEEVARKLTSPAYLDGARHFAVVVWALPDGMTHMDEVPESSPARATFIQCGGAAGPPARAAEPQGLHRPPRHRARALWRTGESHRPESGLSFPAGHRPQAARSALAAFCFPGRAEGAGPIGACAGHLLYEGISRIHQ